MACTCSLSTHSFNFDKKLNAALRHSSKRLDIKHQCLQIRTHISHKITKQVNALQSSHLGDITNITKLVVLANLETSRNDEKKGACGAPCWAMRYATFTSWGEH